MKYLDQDCKKINTVIRLLFNVKLVDVWRGKIILGHSGHAVFTLSMYDFCVIFPSIHGEKATG